VLWLHADAQLRGIEAVFQSTAKIKSVYIYLYLYVCVSDLFDYVHVCLCVRYVCVSDLFDYVHVSV